MKSQRTTGAARQFGLASESSPKPIQKKDARDIIQPDKTLQKFVVKAHLRFAPVPCSILAVRGHAFNASFDRSSPVKKFPIRECSLRQAHGCPPADSSF